MSATLRPGLLRPQGRAGMRLLLGHPAARQLQAPPHLPHLAPCRTAAPPLRPECRFLRLPWRPARPSPGRAGFHGHLGGGLGAGEGQQALSKSGAAFKGAREVKGVQMVKELVAYIWPKDNPGGSRGLDCEREREVNEGY